MTRASIIFIDDHRQTDVVDEPLVVEFDGAWVHVAEVGRFGDRKTIRSYSASVVASVLFSEVTT